MIWGIHYFITKLKTRIAVIPRGCFKVGDLLNTHGGPNDRGQRSQEWGAAVYYGSVKQNDQTALN